MSELFGTSYEPPLGKTYNFPPLNLFDTAYFHRCCSLWANMQGHEIDYLNPVWLNGFA